MSSNSIGKNFTFTTWGESHGKAIGCVIDGVPSNIKLSEKDIQPYLDKRKPGQSKFTTQRKENDTIEILSGTFEGTPSITQPIALPWLSPHVVKVKFFPIEFEDIIYFC